MRWGTPILLLSIACQSAADASRPPETFSTPFSTEGAPAVGNTAFAPLPKRISLDQRKVALGARLFRDRRLSGDGRVACSDCHARAYGGGDGQPRAQLPDRGPVPVNVPSMFNAAFNFRFGWSGRFEDVGQQLDFAIEAKAVMRGSWARATSALARDPREAQAFAAVYRDGLTAANLRQAVAFYTLSLVTPDSRFDHYLRGELALNSDEQQGYELFCDYGCVSCHQGINIGGNMLQRFGLMRDYFADRGEIKPADLGLFATTAREEDRYVFRVPSLRNVARTAPYFHDGSQPSLEGAVMTMARYQLGRELGFEQASRIADFLRTLTGELNGSPL